ncbi:hypothetical protein, partial [Burkholderia sp. LMG 13014]|uniref:hypothetical protein n=1 Tax=Burkholderia sp. LMG 13014 TaxID=2709306 RepID=UPI00196249A1
QEIPPAPLRRTRVVAARAIRRIVVLRSLPIGPVVRIILHVCRFLFVIRREPGSSCGLQCDPDATLRQRR